MAHGLEHFDLGGDVAQLLSRPDSPWLGARGRSRPVRFRRQGALALCDLRERLIERVRLCGAGRGGCRHGRARAPGCGPLTLACARAAVHHLLEPAVELGQRAGDLIVITVRLW